MLSVFGGTRLNQKPENFQEPSLRLLDTKAVAPSVMPCVFLGAEPNQKS